MYACGHERETLKNLYDFQRKSFEKFLGMLYVYSTRAVHFIPEVRYFPLQFTRVGIDHFM